MQSRQRPRTADVSGARRLALRLRRRARQASGPEPAPSAVRAPVLTDEQLALVGLALDRLAARLLLDAADRGSAGRVERLRVLGGVLGGEGMGVRCAGRTPRPEDT